MDLSGLLDYAEGWRQLCCQKSRSKEEDQQAGLAREVAQLKLAGEQRAVAAQEQQRFLEERLAHAIGENEDLRQRLSASEALSEALTSSRPLGRLSALPEHGFAGASEAATITDGSSFHHVPRARSSTSTSMSELFHTSGAPWEAEESAAHGQQRRLNRSGTLASCLHRMQSRHHLHISEDPNDEVPPLVAAARTGDLLACQQLIRGAADAKEAVNQADHEGVTPLMIACITGKEELISALLAAGADPNLADFEGVTPLQTAAFDGYPGIVRQLLRQGAKVDMSDCEGCTALYLAAGNPESPGHEEVVMQLLSMDADPSALAKDGSTPVAVAEYSGNEKVLQMLRKAASSAVTGEDGKRKKRMEGGGGGVVRELRSAGTMFMNMTQLNRAIKGSRQSEQHDQIIVGGTEDEDQETALHTAARYGKVDVIRHLCQSVQDKDLTNNEGQTALYLAAMRGRVEVVTALLEAGADANIPDKAQSTPLNAVVRKEHREVAVVLCQAKANLHQADNEFMSPLLSAAKAGYHTIAKVLVNAGAELAGANRGGRTALHIAAFEGHGATVQYLLEARANADAQDSAGLTPLELAQPSKHADVEQLLIAAMSPASAVVRIRQLETDLA